MGTTVVYILGLYRDNGKENGSYCSVMRYYNRDYGKGNLSYCVTMSYIRTREKTSEAILL